MNSPLASKVLSEDVGTLFPDHPDDKPYYQTFIFSDSLVLISWDESPNSMLKLLIHCWKLVQAMLGVDLPPRGGVSFGEMYIKPELNIFLGKALTDAYELEKNQNWIGVSISKRLENTFEGFFEATKPSEPPTFTEIFDDIFPKYDVPFKREDDLERKQTELRTINWRFNLIAKEGTRAMFSDPKHQDDSISEKISNTLEYAKQIVESGNIYLNDNNLPIELRPFWIGDEEPPFDHGDEL